MDGIISSMIPVKLLLRAYQWNALLQHFFCVKQALKKFIKAYPIFSLRSKINANLVSLQGGTR